MLASNLLAVFFAAGAVAVPLAKPANVELTTVVETDIYDQNGHLITKQFEVGKPKLQEGAAPAAPATPAPQVPAPQPVAPAKQEPKTPPAPAPAKPQPQPEGAVNQISGGSQDTGDTADAHHVGWVEHSDPIFKAMSVWHHNIHRANHSADPVEYDDQLAEAAQAWAEKCVGEEEIPEGSGYGMNVGFSSPDDNYNPSYFISGGWYNSELEKFPGYGNANLPVDGDFGNWGHFSQVVWPDSKKIGCGIAKCPNDPNYKVHAGCMYYPAGNIIGSFDKVKRPEGQPMVYPNGHTSM